MKVGHGTVIASWQARGSIANRSGDISSNGQDIYKDPSRDCLADTLIHLHTSKLNTGRAL
jgi:hypothetical protein